MNEETPAASAPASVNKPVSPVKKPKRPKWLTPAILVGVLLFGAGAAAYVSVFNKSPEQLLSSALNNTASGIDDYLETARNREQSGVSVEGSIRVESPIALDANASGQWQRSNGSLAADIGAAGLRVNAELRTTEVENSEFPDVYVKVDGLSVLGPLLGGLGGDVDVSGLVEQLDGNWYVLDHTYFQQQLNSQQEENQEVPRLSEEELLEIQERVMQVLRERLLTTDESTAVFTIVEKVGKEDFEGTDTYRMRVGINKDNFIAFIRAFEPVINDTRIADLLNTTMPGMDLNEMLQFDEIEKLVNESGFDFENTTADVWVERRGGYIRNIRFYPLEDKKEANYLDLSLAFDGGAVLPLQVRATIDDDGTKGTLLLGADVNRDNGSEGRLYFSVDLNQGQSPIIAEGELSLGDATEEVTVEAPEDARSIFELLGDGLLGLSQPQSPLDKTNVNGQSDFNILDDLEIDLNSL